MRRRKIASHMRLCCTCDGWYDAHEPDEVKQHMHPEPQSGPPRAAWMASRLPYEAWVVETVEGRAWRKASGGER
jgi:hypothetical protein